MNKAVDTMFDALADWLMGSTPAEEADKARKAMLRRRQLRRYWPWLVWVLLVFVVDVFVVPATAPLGLRVALGLAVIPSIVMIGRARFQLIAQLDELQQRIEYQAMGFSFVLTLCVLLTGALLQDMHVPWPRHVSLIVLFWLLFASHWLAGRYLRRRYR